MPWLALGAALGAAGLAMLALICSGSSSSLSSSRANVFIPVAMVARRRAPAPLLSMHRAEDTYLRACGVAQETDRQLSGRGRLRMRAAAVQHARGASQLKVHAGVRADADSSACCSAEPYHTCSRPRKVAPRHFAATCTRRLAPARFSQRPDPRGGVDGRACIDFVWSTDHLWQGSGARHHMQNVLRHGRACHPFQHVCSTLRRAEATRVQASRDLASTMWPLPVNQWCACRVPCVRSLPLRDPVEQVVALQQAPPASLGQQRLRLRPPRARTVRPRQVELAQADARTRERVRTDW